MIPAMFLADVAFATLNCPIIGSIHIGNHGKLFLRPADALTLSPDPFAQFVKGRLLVHRTG